MTNRIEVRIYCAHESVVGILKQAKLLYFELAEGHGRENPDYSRVLQQTVIVGFIDENKYDALSFIPGVIEVRKICMMEISKEGPLNKHMTWRDVKDGWEDYKRKK